MTARLPASRGAISARILSALPGAPGRLSGPAPPLPDDTLGDEDLQLALYCCYELHYRGFDGVDDGWEWEPSLLALRARLEAEFEGALEAVVPPLDPAELPAAGEMDVALRAIADADEGPSLSRHLERD